MASKKLYRIETAKGRHTGTLLECLEWQAELHGAFPTITHPDGRERDLDVVVAWRDDPYRLATDPTPTEAERRMLALFADDAACQR